MSQFPRIEDEGFRERVCAWLRANGIDPNRTPMYPHPSITHGYLTIWQKVHREGGDVLNEERTEVLTETITVPVLVAPEGDIAEWVRDPA